MVLILYRASPRLKDAQLPADSLNTLYTELVLIVRRLFHRCKLVHADLSEYNILYHENHLYIIDVSQSVEHDHPSAFDFLRNDIKNVEDFFGRLGAQCLGLRRCFEFVTRAQLIPESQELPPTTEEIDELESKILTHWMKQHYEVQDETTFGSGRSTEDSIFLRSFIPRTLNEVYDPERDVEKILKGEDGELIYTDTIGIIKPTSALALNDENQNVGGNPAEQKMLSAPQTSTPSTKVQFVTSAVAPADDRADQRNVNTSTADARPSDGGGDGSNQGNDETGSYEEEDEEGEGGSDDEIEQQNKDGWVEKKPKGHRHEDREAKKVSP